MRVLSYLENSIWAIRAKELSTMVEIARRETVRLDEILNVAESGKNFEANLAKKGERLNGTRYVEIRENGVAVIDLNGVIAKRMSYFQEVCGSGTSTEMLARDFQACLDSPNVSSIVFNINSPGGEAFGINEFANQVFAARGKKPIRAYVAGLGCSGAYWIAAACDEITVDASAFVGSIGVVTVWTDDKKFYEMLGIQKEVITSTNAPKKRLDFNNAEDRDEIQAELDAMEAVFHKFVAKSRNVTVKQVIEDFNQGGVRLGKDAVAAKMADKVGSLESVIKESRNGRGKSNVSAEADQLQLNLTGDKSMSLKDRIMAIFAEEETAPMLDAGKNETSQQAAASSAKIPELIAAEAEVARLKAEKEHGKINAVQTKATTLAAAEISAGRMLPTEKEDFVAAYVQASGDDESSPLAEGSRVARIEAQQTKRVSNGLTQEIVNADTNKIVFGQMSSDKEMDAAVEAQANDYDRTVSPGKAQAAK